MIQVEQYLHVHPGFVVANHKNYLYLPWIMEAEPPKLDHYGYLSKDVPHYLHNDCIQNKLEQYKRE